jgi:organic hydroperoxide reductase OsmC/OhrA
MHPFPHHYIVSAAASAQGSVRLTADGVAPIDSAAPKEFDGPGDRWSPETLLTAAVVDCFILSFRAVAGASKFNWTSLDCRTEGKLDRIEGKSKFTQFHTSAKLVIPAGGDVERAKKMLEKAEQICLIANSLAAERHLTAEVAMA